MMTTLSQVKHAVAEVLGHDPRTIDPDERLMDMGADSLKTLEIEMALVEDFRMDGRNDLELGQIFSPEATCQSIANWLDALA